MTRLLLLNLLFCILHQALLLERTGVHLTVSRIAYRGNGRYPCVGNFDYCRILLRDKPYASDRTLSYYTLYLSNSNTFNATFSPPLFKEYIYYPGYIDSENVDITYDGVNIQGFPDPPFKNSTYIDTLTHNFRDNFMHIVCNPCIGIYLGIIDTYGTLKVFFVSIKTKHRYASAIMPKIKLYQSCIRGIVKQCVANLYTNNACDGVFTPYNHMTLVVNLKQLTENTHSLIRIFQENTNIPIISASQSNINSLFTHPNRVGFAMYDNENFINCYDDIIWIENFIRRPYDLFVEKNVFGGNKQMQGDIWFFYGAYGYAGLRSQFECNVEKESDKCDDQGNKICADTSKSGRNCDIENSICSTNPCRNNGICKGTNTNYFCKCKLGSYGKNCENIFCSQRCYNRLCVGPEICGSCLPGYSGTNCTEVTCQNYKGCNFGKCEIRNGNRQCICDDNQYTGNRCQFKCNPSCENGRCRVLNGLVTCVCFQGFFGASCNSIVNVQEQRFVKSDKFILDISLYTGVTILILLIILFIVIYGVRIKNSLIFKLGNEGAQIITEQLDAGMGLIDNIQSKIDEINPNKKNNMNIYSEMNNVYSNYLENTTKEMYFSNDKKANEYGLDEKLSKQKNEEIYDKTEDYAEGYFKIT